MVRVTVDCTVTVVVVTEDGSVTVFVLAPPLNEKQLQAEDSGAPEAYFVRQLGSVSRLALIFEPVPEPQDATVMVVVVVPPTKVDVEVL